MEENGKEEHRKIRRKKIPIFIGLLIVAFLVMGVAFSYFYITTEARLTLREAKNVKLALDMLDIEYYGMGKSVYNPASGDGLSENVEKQVYDIAEQSGRIAIRSYDRMEHKITYMTYETAHYRISFQYDRQKGDLWKVEYFMTIFDYSDRK